MCSKGHLVHVPNACAQNKYQMLPTNISQDTNGFTKFEQRELLPVSVCHFLRETVPIIPRKRQNKCTCGENERRDLVRSVSCAAGDCRLILKGATSMRDGSKVFLKWITRGAGSFPTWSISGREVVFRRSRNGPDVSLKWSWSGSEDLLKRLH